MGMKNPLSGTNDEALTTVGTDVRELITGTDFDGDGRTFRLKGLSFINEHAAASGIVELADQDEAAITAANQRPPSIYVLAETSVIIDLNDPGIRFVTNLVAGVSAGTFAALSQGAWGYLE